MTNYVEKIKIGLTVTVGRIKRSKGHRELNLKLDFLLVRINKAKASIGSFISQDDFNRLMTVVDDIKNQANINLIYKHTHPDYKSLSGGNKCILVFIDGATCLSPIKSLSADLFAKKLSSAVQREIK